MLNRVFLIGNLTRDPEVKYTPSGLAITTFGLAVNNKYRDRNQQLKEEVLFIRVDTFAKVAEFCGQYLKKGRRVFVEGRLKMDSWEKDGQKQTRIDVVGMSVQFLDARPPEGDGAASQAQRPAAAPQPQAAAPAQQPAAAPSRPEEYPDYAPAGDVPEMDVNDVSYTEPAAGEAGTNDDLPF
jgi:single-strand DNA-binding protein